MFVRRYRPVILIVMVAAFLLVAPQASGQTPVIAGAARPSTLPGARPADLGAGADGTLYAIDNANVYRWDGAAWQGIGMSGRKIDVGPVGPYIVTGNNEVWYRPFSEPWQRVPGFGASNLGVGAGGHLWALGVVQADGGYDVWRHLGGDAWEPAPGRNAVNIDVAPDGVPWIVDQGMNIYRRENNTWQQVPGRAVDIAIGSDGTVWALDGSEVDPQTGAFSIKRWTGSAWERAPQYGWNIIAAKDRTTVYSVGGDSQVFSVTFEAQATAAGGQPQTGAGQPAAAGAGAPATCNSSAAERRIAELMRQHAGQKRTSLTCHPILEKVARERTLDMAKRNYFEHTNPDGFGPNYLVRQAGYVLPNWYGTDPKSNFIESIQRGAATPEGAFESWLNSPGHRRHLLAEAPFYAAQQEYGISALQEFEGRTPNLYVVLTATREN